MTTKGDPLTTEQGHVIEHLPDAHRFRVLLAGRQVAELDYRPLPGAWDLTHTYADPALRGTGIAGEMVRQAMDQARTAGLRIIPSCPYIPVWLRRNPEYADLVQGPA